MNHDIWPELGKQPLDDRFVSNGVLDKFQIRVRREIVAAAGREVVDTDNLVSPREQHVDHARSDLPRGAGDKYLHIVFPLVVEQKRKARPTSPRALVTAKP